jgi:ATP-dependent exoDNAse (exonuclease V) beta subunit
MLEKLENIALVSSAGAGKTRALTQRFLYLYLLDHAKLDQLYGITFTNEAAFEMKTRILRYLELLSTGKPKDKSEEAVFEYFIKRFPDVEKRAMTLRNHLLHNLSDLKISTFHSLFASFLSSIPFVAGIMPGYQIIDEPYENLLYEHALDRYLESVFENPQTTRAIDELVMQREVGVKRAINDVYWYILPWLHYLEDLVHRSSELRKTVTRSHSELVRALRTFSTFVRDNEHAGYTQGKKQLNSNLMKMLAHIDDFLESGNVESLFGSTCTEAIFSREIAEKNYIKRFAHGCGSKTDEFSTLLVGLIDSAQKHLVALSDESILIHLRPVIDIHGILHEEKRRLNVLGFNDIEQRTLRALHSTSETDYLYFKIGSIIAHLLIDEFQDTSRQQLEIIEPLISEILSVDPQVKSLFYVGDPKQAIYRWRGGTPELFHYLTNEYPGKIQQKELVTNYRSKEEIVDFVNTVLDKKDVAKPDNAGGWVRVVDCGTVDERADGVEHVMNTTTKTISELHDRYGYAYSDMALLVRTNTFGAALADKCTSAGIPCVSRSRSDILSNNDVCFVLNLLRFLENPEDDYALLHVLFSSPFELKEETVRQFNYSPHTLYMNLARSHPGWKVTKTLSRLLNLVHMCTPYELIHRIYEELQLDISYGLATLLDIAHGYTIDEYGHLTAFLEWIEKIGESFEVREVHPEGVKILTVHRAKGLEFEVVMLPETDWNLRNYENQQLLYAYDKTGTQPERIYWRRYGKYFKDLKQAEQERLEKDELNLLYVALTRAKLGLHIFGYTYHTRSAGFWFEHILSRMDAKDRAIGNIVGHATPLAIKETSGTYGSMKKEPPLVKEERVLYSPTERGIELMDSARRRSMEYGSIVHFALSRIGWLDDVDLDEVVDSVVDETKAVFMRAPKEHDLFTGTLHDMLLATLDDPQLRFIFFQDGRSVTCKNEVSLFFAEEKRDVSGIIDRLLVTPRELTVIDYKTGEEKKEYVEQLKIYRRGLEKTYPDRRINTILVFLEHAQGKRCVEVG